MACSACRRPCASRDRRDRRARLGEDIDLLAFREAAADPIAPVIGATRAGRGDSGVRLAGRTLDRWGIRIEAGAR